MTARQRSVTATAIGAVVVTFLAACSHANASRSGTLGSAIAPSATGLGSAPSPNPTPGKNGSGGNGGGGNGSTGHGSASTSASSGTPSSPGNTVYTFIAPNFSAKATGHCAWDADQAGNIYLDTEFTISYSGLVASTATPWSVGNDRNSYTTTGTATSLPKTFNVRMGGQPFSASAWPGNVVKVTMTISPSGSDSNAADNTASIKLHLPSNPPTADLLTTVPCS